LVHETIEKDLISGWAYLISMGGEEWSYGIFDIS
jgi:hypothetical protein